MNTLDVCGVFAGVASTPFATFPTVSEMIAIASKWKASIWMHHGLYVSTDPSYGGHGPFPPWTIPPDRLDDFKTLVRVAWNLGHTICPYTSLFYSAWPRPGIAPRTYRDYIADVQKLRSATGCHGIYIDGLNIPYGTQLPGNPAENQVVMAAVRSIFGAEGTIILHGTNPNGHGGYTLPQINAEKLASLILRGEGVNINDLPSYLNNIVLGGPQNVPFSMLPVSGWPDADRQLWLATHGASALGYVGMYTGTDGWTVFDNGTSSDLEYLRRYRAQHSTGNNIHVNPVDNVSVSPIPKDNERKIV